jgi:uncharacterized protein (DUF697 family)
MKRSNKNSDMKHDQDTGGWALVPGTQEDIETLRKKCRRLVLRRAAMSAGVAAVPIPGIDIVADLSLLVSLVEDINAEFGLTPAQISRLRPELRLIAYETMVGMSGVLVGKLVTRELVARLLKRTGMKAMVKYSAKIVPVAGQIVSAAVGFAAFRTIGNQHVEACAKVALELLVADVKPAR